MNTLFTGKAVREHASAYAETAAKQAHSLVRELWALRGRSDLGQVRRIADASGLKVRWLAKLPTVNGETGVEKLMEERNVLLLRDRKSPFIEQFQHPLGRCAKFYKLFLHSLTLAVIQYWAKRAFRPFSAEYGEHLQHQRIVHEKGRKARLAQY